MSRIGHYGTHTCMETMPCEGGATVVMQRGENEGYIYRMRQRVARAELVSTGVCGRE